jgi:hypothetical protein
MRCCFSRKKQNERLGQEPRFVEATGDLTVAETDGGVRLTRSWSARTKRCTRAGRRTGSGNAPITLQREGTHQGANDASGFIPRKRSRSLRHERKRLGVVLRRGRIGLAPGYSDQSLRSGRIRAYPPRRDLRRGLRSLPRLGANRLGRPVQLLRFRVSCRADSGMTGSCQPTSCLRIMFEWDGFSLECAGVPRGRTLGREKAPQNRGISVPTGDRGTRLEGRL